MKNLQIVQKINGSKDQLLAHHGLKYKLEIEFLFFLIQIFEYNKLKISLTRPFSSLLTGAIHMRA